MTEWRWFPRNQRELCSDSRRHLSANAREPRKLLPTSRTHTSSWNKVGSYKFPTLMLDIQHEPVQTLEKTKMWSMGSTTNLSRYSKEMDSYVEWGRSIGQPKGHEGALKWITTIRHTITIVLGADFDLTIAQFQIKGCEYSNSNKETLYFFSKKRSKHALEKEQVKLSSCL